MEISPPYHAEPPEKTARELAQLAADLLAGKTTPAAIAGLDQLSLETLYAEGYDAWHDGDIDAACAQFAWLVMHQPLDPRFHYAFGCALQASDLPRHALTFFGYAITLDARDPFPIYHVAQCLQQLEELDAARDALDAVIQLCEGQIHEADYQALRDEAHRLRLAMHY